MRFPMKRALVIAGFVLVFAGAAQARSQQPPLPSKIAIGNLPGCMTGTLTDPQPLMQSFHATILRVVISAAHRINAHDFAPAYGTQGQALPCLSAAQAEGYRVMVVLEWNSVWSTQQVRTFFKKELKIYGPYAWAIGVGNEEEISPALSGYGYSRDWKAVLPLLRQLAPYAIRVGGEISPWGLPFLENALSAGLPGMQALGVHTYRYKWSFTMPQVLQLAHRYRVPLWCDEGLYDGPNSWRPKWPRGGSDFTLSQMRGAVVAGAWDKLGPESQTQPSTSTTASTSGTSGSSGSSGSSSGGTGTTGG